MTLHDSRQFLHSQLSTIYDVREAAAITDLVLENLTGWRKVDRIIHKDDLLSPIQLDKLEKYSSELMRHKPVQYVLNEAWFCGMRFYVDENVLIPRPETEELVDWVVSATKNPSELHMLDIGTGSGCIPIALKKSLPGSLVISCDVSASALAVARRNAMENKVEIELIHLDFLQPAAREQLSFFDVIVSNPPYIPLQDKKTMQANVVEYEPHVALFVEDADPLVFYHAIAIFSKEKLRKGGKVFVEVHESLADQVAGLFSSHGFSPVETKTDMQGKMRMVKATRLL